MILIKTLPELSKIISLYKNPYLLCHYNGIDWNNYINYNINCTNSLKINENLYVISCMKNQTYKVKQRDFIKTLCGEIIVDNGKKIEEDMYYMIYNNDYNDYNDYREYMVCNGNHEYNSFFHYKF